MPEMDRHYKAFCNDLADIFDKDWNRIEDRFITAYQFLVHIPASAWRPMVAIAADTWEGWPRNWVRAVKEVYGLYRKSEPLSRKVEFCAECNGAGIFSAFKRIEVKPNVFMRYFYTYRCKACRNWVGQYGMEIPEMLPLTSNEFGYDGIETYSSPMPEKTEYYSLSDMLELAGKRVNQFTQRPAIQKNPDEIIPF